MLPDGQQAPSLVSNFPIFDIRAGLSYDNGNYRTYVPFVTSHSSFSQPLAVIFSGRNTTTDDRHTSLWVLNCETEEITHLTKQKYSYVKAVRHPTDSTTAMYFAFAMEQYNFPAFSAITLIQGSPPIGS